VREKPVVGSASDKYSVLDRGTIIALETVVGAASAMHSDSGYAVLLRSRACERATGRGTYGVCLLVKDVERIAGPVFTGTLEMHARGTAAGPSFALQRWRDVDDNEGPRALPSAVPKL